MFNKINCFIDVMIEKSQIDDDLISQKVCVEANNWVFSISSLNRKHRYQVHACPDTIFR